MRIPYLFVRCLSVFDPYLYFIPDVHLTNVAVQKAAPDYDPGKARGTRGLQTIPPLPAVGALLADASKLTSSRQLPRRGRVLQPLNCAALSPDTHKCDFVDSSFRGEAGRAFCFKCCFAADCASIRLVFLTLNLITFWLALF